MLGDDDVRCEWRAEYDARKGEWAEGRGKTIEQLFGLHVKFNGKARYVVEHEGDEHQPAVHRLRRRVRHAEQPLEAAVR